MRAAQAHPELPCAKVPVLIQVLRDHFLAWAEQQVRCSGGGGMRSCRLQQQSSNQTSKPKVFIQATWITMHAICVPPWPWLQGGEGVGDPADCSRVIIFCSLRAAVQTIVDALAQHAPLIQARCVAGAPGGEAAVPGPSMCPPSRPGVFGVHHAPVRDVGHGVHARAV
jgi:hypothetical protein